MCPTYLHFYLFPDAEELRKSQRRPRPSDLGQQSNPSNPSQESDFDEDEDGLSTPTAEKSMTSMLSVSSENVDRVGRRERFMKNNFESLSGADQQQQQSHNTISNQFREGTSEIDNSSTCIFTSFFFCINYILLKKTHEI